MVESAVYDDRVRDFAERMASSPQENVGRVNDKIEILKSREFAHYGDEVNRMWVELQALGQDIKAAASDPVVGLELVAAVFRIDGAIMNNCDDSLDEIGSFFTDDLTEIFVSLASSFRNKEWIRDLVIELCRNDEYGVREKLLDRVAEYLPREHVLQVNTAVSKDY